MLLRFAGVTGVLILVLSACSDSSPAATEDTGSVDRRTEPVDDLGSDRSRLPSDSGAACKTPTPFVAPGKPEGWRHGSTGLLVVTQGAANHRGQDVVVVAGKPQLLIGKFAYGLFDKDLEGEDVEIFIQEKPPCGPWISHGVFTSPSSGSRGAACHPDRCT